MSTELKEYDTKLPYASMYDRRLALQRLFDNNIEPSPAQLLQDSLHPDAPLHDFFYSTDDALWVQYGRYEAARRIITSVKVDVQYGEKSISVRAVEFVKVDGEGRWARIENIVDDDVMIMAYMKEIEDLNAQAAAKMSRLRALMSRNK